MVANSGTALTSKGANTRIRVLECARQVLVAEGYDALALRDLAKRCNMQLGNLQYYFPTRDALLEAIIAAEADQDVAALKSARNNSSHKDWGDPVQHFTALVNHLVSRWRGESGIIFGMLNFLALNKPAFRALRDHIYATFYAELAGLIQQIDPSLDGASRDLRVTLITALIDGAAQQIRIGDSQRYVEAVADAALRIVHTAKPVG